VWSYHAQWGLKNPGFFETTRFVSHLRGDTVGELKSAEICVSHIPSLKVKKLGKLPREKILLEPWSRFANSIGAFFETMAGAAAARRGTHPRGGDAAVGAAGPPYCNLSLLLPVLPITAYMGKKGVQCML